MAGQRGDRASGAPFVERAPELREASRLGDHEPAQLEQPRSHHGRELPAGQVAEVGFDVAAVLELDHLGVDGIARLVDGDGHDLREEPFLVGEVLVDGLLGDAGNGGDLVHARSEVAVAQERGGGGLDDRALRVRPDRLSSGGSIDSEYWTVSSWISTVRSSF